MNSKINRRSFFKKGLTGAAAISLGPVTLLGTENKKSEGTKIITRKLGKTGLELPVVSMGVMNADNPNLLKAAYKSGIRHFDTAHGYQRGRNEEMCGKVLKEMERDSFVISTKIPGNDFDVDSNYWEIETDAEEFVEDFETSLKRLGMDYVDILYFHGRSNKQEVLEEDLLNVMVKLKEQGKARFLGVSTHRNEPEVIDAVTESKIYDVVLTAYNFRQEHHQKVAASIERASKAGIGVIAMKTQAGVFWDEDEEENKINMQAALKWVLQNPHVHTTIPGFVTFDQMREDIEIMEDLVLSPKEIKDLNFGKETGKLGLYCNQCGECNKQCPHDLDIPTIMRSYMYAFGYKNFYQAKDTLLKTGIRNLPCNQCKECRVECVSGFDVRTKLSKIYDIKEIPDTFLS